MDLGSTPGSASNLAKVRCNISARVVKLVDTRDLKSLVGNDVPVQVRPRAPFFFYIIHLPTHTFAFGTFAFLRILKSTHLRLFSILSMPLSIPVITAKEYCYADNHSTKAITITVRR